MKNKTLLFRLCALVAAMMSALGMQAQPEAYACLTTSDSTLTFYYDGSRSTRPGVTYSLNTGKNRPEWYNSAYSYVSRVVFTPSFGGARPTSTYCWFDDFILLKSISGLEYLNTSSVTNMNSMFNLCIRLTSLDVSHFNTANVTDMHSMFSDCDVLTSLDVSHFNTENVTDMSNMFQCCKALTSLNVSSFNTANVKEMQAMFLSCTGLTSLDLGSFNTAKVTDMGHMFYDNPNLTTIYVGSEWNTDAVTKSNDMFGGCTSLVGGMGTTYNSSHVDKAYAHIDGGPSNPGYLTEWKEAYACYTSSNTTLTFYYDNLRSTRTGRTYDLNEGDNKPDWNNSSIASPVQTVVFDPSFAGARPTTTYGWFRGMYYLSSISGMEYLNTSEVTNMSSMFEGCSGLTSLDLRYFDTKKVTDMSSMFNGCHVTTLDVSGFNTGNVTDMSEMFFNCSDLSSLDVSNFNTAKVTNMAAMFSDCKKLTSLDLSSFNTANVTNMAMMFYLCQSLTSLDLSSFNTANVIDMEDMFYFCTSLTSLDVSHFNTANVTNMEVMFAYCSSLTSLDVSSFNTANVIDMEVMFAYCSSLTSLDLSSFNTANVTNMEGMFYECPGLTSLDLSSFNTANVTTMYYMFNNCSSLTTIYVGDGWSTAAVTNSDEMFTGCTKIRGGMGTTYDANHVDAAYAHIDGGTSNPGYFTAGAEAYAVYTSSNTTLTFYCDNLRNTRPGTSYALNTGSNNPGWYTDGTRSSVTNVVFDASFADARPTTTYRWFREMRNLTTIVGMKEYLNTSQVTSMNAMFFVCRALPSVDLTHFNTENVTDMRGMFGDCFSLTSLDLSSFNTANVTNMGGMFNQCSGLTSLDLNSFNTANVTDMDLMFGNCSNLATIMVGEGWSTESVIYSDEMFTDCVNLVGGMGTTYDENHVEADYAHIDGGPSNPGYLTEWKEAYACYTSDNKTLTFYYDKLRSTRPGTTYDLNEGNNNPGWRTDGTNSSIQAVVFDASFADARPTTTKCWFSNMYLITTITGMEYLNTSEVTNMNSMFYNCYGLTSLDLRHFNTTNVTDMYGMFNYCDHLSNIDVSGFNTTNVTNMIGTFQGCRGLTSLDLSNFNTAKVTNMSSMFASCTGLTNLDLSSFNTTNVTSMGSMFSYCSGLTSLDLSNFNTSNVTYISGMFSGCSGLTSLDVSGFNTEKVEDMGSMFSNCTSLTSLDLSSFNTSKVESMYYMFEDNSNLTTIYVGSEWSTAAVSTSYDMFSRCTSLVGGMGTAYSASNPKDKTYAHIDGGPSNPGYFTDINAAMEPYAVYTPENTTLTFYCDGQRNSRPGTTYDLNEGSNQPGWIVDEIYLDVTQVLFDPSFADARPVSTHAWFYCMANVQSITGLEYLNTSEVTKMGAMFMGCESITSLDLRHFNTENVTDMFNMFNSCCSLTSLDVSRFNTAKVIDMRGMFVECSKLTSLDLSSFNTAKVENMNTMFNCDSRLTTIFVGDEWSTAEALYSNEMFYGCTSLVGGKGTTYDPNHVDKAYAHIDGGPSNPGYFTDKSDFLRGDVDGDGFVKISDVTALIDYLLTGNAAGINLDAADCDLDGDVKISDVTELIDYLLRGFWW